MIAAAPPPAGTFFSFSSARKPIHAPSGEMNGAVAPSVPGSGAASSRSNERSYSCDVLARAPTNTMRRPSGESAIDVRAGRSPPKKLTVICSAGRTSVCRCMTGDVPAVRRGTSQPAAAPTRRAAAIHGST